MICYVPLAGCDDDMILGKHGGRPENGTTTVNLRDDDEHAVSLCHFVRRKTAMYAHMAIAISIAISIAIAIALVIAIALQVA